MAIVRLEIATRMHRITRRNQYNPLLLLRVLRVPFRAFVALLNPHNFRLHRIHNRLQIFDPHRQRRHENNNIPQRTQNHPMPANPLANLRPDPQFWIERLPRRLLFNEFNPNHKTLLPYITQMSKLAKTVEHRRITFEI